MVMYAILEGLNRTNRDIAILSWLIKIKANKYLKKNILVVCRSRRTALAGNRPSRPSRVQFRRQNARPSSKA